MLKHQVAVGKKCLEWISKGLFVLGGVALTLMMLLTAFDVMLRNTIELAIPGSFELTEYIMAIVVSFGLAYCGFLKGHIACEVIIGRLPHRFKIILSAITTLASFLIAGIMAWQSFANMRETIQLGLFSKDLLIPVYPFIGITGLGLTIFSLILLIHFFELLLNEAKT